MQVYSEIQHMAQIKRTRGEKWLTRVYLLNAFLQIACYIMTFARIYRNTAHSLSTSFFLSSTLNINMNALTPDCTLPVSERYGFFSNVNYSIGKDNIAYIASRCATNIRFLFGVTAGYILVCCINRTFVGMRKHMLRYHFFVFRKDTVMMWELILSVIGIVYTFMVNEEGLLLKSYISTCGLRNTRLDYATPFIEFFFLYFFTFFILLLSGIAAFLHLCEPDPLKPLISEEMMEESPFDQSRSQSPEFAPERGFGSSASRPQTPLTLPQDAPGTRSKPLRSDIFAPTPALRAPTPLTRSQVGGSAPPMMSTVDETRENFEDGSKM